MLTLIPRRMVIGVHGVLGLVVVSLVEVELNREKDHAILLHQLMEEDIVQDRIHCKIFVTKTLVQPMVSEFALFILTKTKLIRLDMFMWYSHCLINIDPL